MDDVGIMRNITGYHGTSKNHGDKIIREQNISPSTKNSEWLGHGIYFWAYRGDAVWWGMLESQKERNKGYSPVVLISELTVQEDRFLDLDDSAQYTAFCAEAEKVMKGACGLAFDNMREARCFVSNYYAKAHNIDLLAYTFTKRNHTTFGFDQVNKRQYCVKNKEIIQSIKMEVDDYAV